MITGPSTDKERGIAPSSCTLITVEEANAAAAAVATVPAAVEKPEKTPAELAKTMFGDLTESDETS